MPTGAIAGMMHFSICMVASQQRTMFLHAFHSKIQGYILRTTKLQGNTWMDPNNMNGGRGQVQCPHCHLKPCVVLQYRIEWTKSEKDIARRNVRYWEIAKEMKTFFMKRFCTMTKKKYSVSVNVPECVQLFYFETKDHWFRIHSPDYDSDCSTSNSSVSTIPPSSLVEYHTDRTDILFDFKNGDGRDLVGSNGEFLPASEIMNPVFIFREFKHPTDHWVYGGTMKTIFRPLSGLDHHHLCAAVFFADCLCRELVHWTSILKNHHERAAGLCIRNLHLVAAEGLKDRPFDFLQSCQPFPFVCNSMISSCPLVALDKSVVYHKDFIKLFEGTCVFDSMIIGNFCLAEINTLEKYNFEHKVASDPYSARKFVVEMRARFDACWDLVGRNCRHRDQLVVFAREHLLPKEHQCGTRVGKLQGCGCGEPCWQEGEDCIASPCIALWYFQNT